MVVKPKTEHFCTLFDSKFLLMGLALHRSLVTHARAFHLWILCMDELVETQLREIALPHVTLIPLGSIETTELRAVKPGRTTREYCWTLSPFICEAVFHQAPDLERVTYLDADLFFFGDPQVLLRELDESGKHVLITEHAFAPEYESAVSYGRFCVQFLTFRNTAQAAAVWRWWQARCLEWCFARIEPGRFGDQGYLDQWPSLFPEQIHIVRQTEKTLAPWNVRHQLKTQPGAQRPIFYHFQGLRFGAPDKVRLYAGCRIGREGMWLYRTYIQVLVSVASRLQAQSIPLPFLPQPPKAQWLLRNCWWLVVGWGRIMGLSGGPVGWCWVPFPGAAVCDDAGGWRLTNGGSAALERVGISKSD